MKIIKLLCVSFVLSSAVSLSLLGCDGDNGSGAGSGNTTGNNTTHTHDWGDWTVTTPATCDAAGVETRTCKSDATHKETRAIAKLTGSGCATAHVHDWGNWVVTTQATCDAAGVETRTCKIDNTHKETRTIAKLTGASCNSTDGDDSYEWVMVRRMKWMSKNLNIETEDSWCYENSADSCKKYGRLYTWAAAVSACPSGWHLPTQDEWNILAKEAGGRGDYYALGPAGTALKSRSGWNSDYAGKSGNGTDEFRFSALPGGQGGPDGIFLQAGDYGYWWMATENNADQAGLRFIANNTEWLLRSVGLKSRGLSVRCVKDE